MKSFKEFLVESDQDKSHITHLIITGTTYGKDKGSRLRNIKKTKRHFTIYELDHENKTKKEVGFKSFTGEGQETDEKVRDYQEKLKKKYPNHEMDYFSSHRRWHDVYKRL